METAASSYSGPDRRRHRVFVTRNTEYHCRDGICVAVRDRRTGQFATLHVALGRKMSASLKFTDDGGIGSFSPPEAPQLGEQLCFSAGVEDLDRDVLTSPLTAIERPPKEIVRRYGTGH